jgi:hypothetical protein
MAAPPCHGDKSLGPSKGKKQRPGSRIMFTNFWQQIHGPGTESWARGPRRSPNPNGQNRVNHWHLAQKGDQPPDQEE